jgi:hypothetical protein
MSSIFYHAFSRFALLAVVLVAATAAATEPAPAGGDGMVIYRDPATGRIAAPPPGALPPEVSSFSATPGPVTETQGASAAGGWKADTRRFRSSMQATADGAGPVAHDCVPGGQ